MIITGPDSLLVKNIDDLKQRISDVKNSPLGDEVSRSKLIKGYKQILKEVSVLNKSDQAYELTFGKKSGGYVRTNGDGTQTYLGIFRKCLTDCLVIS